MLHHFIQYERHHHDQLRHLRFQNYRLQLHVR